MPVSPETVAVVLAAEADRDLHPATIAARAARPKPARPCQSLAIAAVLAGIRRTRRVLPQCKAQALELGPLARMVELIDTGTVAGCATVRCCSGSPPRSGARSSSHSMPRTGALKRFADCSSASGAPRRTSLSKASSSRSRTPSEVPVATAHLLTGSSYGNLP
jgi:hypothetical protein